MHKHRVSEFVSQSNRRLQWAVLVNVGLTLAQIIGGVLSGSLALIADALHNLSDAASLGIALFAVRIGARPPDEFKTFGYRRAELIAALINLTTLVIIGAYLVYEAIWRFFDPGEIHGLTVILVSTIALVVDVATGLLTYSLSKKSLNIRAAFLHNVSDALSSVGVIVGGILILCLGWFWVDAIITVMIASYVLWQGFTEMPRVIHILMEGTPKHLSIDQVVEVLEGADGVVGVHHVHVWQLDEHSAALEAHVVTDVLEVDRIPLIMQACKSILKKQFGITHSTLELELPGTDCRGRSGTFRSDECSY